MNRAMPLLVLVAVAGVGLTYFALQTGPQRTSTTDEVIGTDPPEPADPPAVAEHSEGDHGLATVTKEPGPDRFGPGGPAKAWEVIPMNSVGQPIAGAKITATQATEIRTGSGRTKWESLPAGPWQLVIESEGNPTWRREVLLVAGRPTRTAARLGEEMRIEGTVRDSRGVAIVNTDVFLLPPGVRHPERSDMKADRAHPRDPAQPQNGAVVARLNSSGHFSTKLPRAGEWRVSVGPASTPRWTQPKPSELTYGGPDHVTATIPANAKLLVSFRGLEGGRPRQISAYIYDAKAAALTRQNRQERYVDKGLSLQDAQKAAKGGGKGGGGKRGGNGEGGDEGAPTGKGEILAAMDAKGNSYASGAGPQRGGGGKQLFEPGWRTVKTARVDDSGQALFEDMPGGEDLRFLFIRGKERIITPGSYRLLPARTSTGVVTLPPLDTEPDRGPDTRASIKIGLAPADDEAEQPEPGVLWGY